MLPLTAEQVEAELCRRDFERFVKRAWREIDPANLVWGWHLSAICKHLQAVAEGRIKNLIITVPPGHAKSMTVSVLFPAWQWARKPSWQLMHAAKDMSLVLRDATKSRLLTDSEWFRTNFVKEKWDWRKDQNTKSLYANSVGGHRVSVSVGQGTGKRGDCLIIDDPIEAAAARSQLERRKVIDWHDGTMITRFNDLSSSSEILIMQRLHEEDLAGHLIKRGNYQHLNLPTEFEPHARCITYDVDGKEFWRDPRTEEGELLFPQKFPREVIESLKVALGSFEFAAQHQQRPVPAEGGLIKAEWLSRRYLAPTEHAIPGMDARRFPAPVDEWLMVADCAFKKTDTSDRVAIGVFARKGPDVFLVDLAWRRMNFAETIQAIIDLRRKHQACRRTIIEDKANGSAVIETLQRKLPGIIPVQPDGGKEARVSAVTPYLEAGNFYLPASAPWVADFIQECVSFPRGANDDAIDMTAYALFRLLASRTGGRLDVWANR